MIHFNGEPELYVDESVAQCLDRHGIGQRGIAVAVDGEVVRRRDWGTSRLHDGARVEVVTAVAGG